MSINQCINCKSWIKKDYSDVGICNKIIHDVRGRYHLQIFENGQLDLLIKAWEEDEKINKELAVISTDDYKYKSGACLTTQGNFGCNLFEVKS